MNRPVRRAALASVAVALLLGALKAWAALKTGSVAVLASLADSLLDLVASLVTLGGVRWAMQPADAEHRFGHGKAEALAALFQVGVIAVSAFAILLRAIERLSTDQTSTDPEYGIGVSIVAFVLTLALTSYQRSVIRRTRSVAIGADHVHYQSDLLLNGAVIVALVLEGYLGLAGADPLFGIAIAFWLMFGAWRASVEAINQLMDREWPEEKRRRLVEVACGLSGFERLHDLRTRTSGNRDFVQFHIWVDPDMSVAAAHDVVEALERALADEFPGIEVLIHLDPAGQVDDPHNPLVEADESAFLKETKR
ncbi:MULTISPECIES: cation diffusion facilitator family transporter [unclassified Sphingosinithalassobacter]|uniref:cation diffusion facilitator family transporter n=1 Tax=unclassified Sphingosinithalassobacter TaxID=2676235 RepID=UPI00165E7152|nr:cation diffusion facilitator family transporter [Sphingosinithalassobacter sp. CS137]